MANISSINGNPIVVGTNGISDGAVTSAKLASNAVATSNIADSAVTGAKLDSATRVSIGGITELKDALTRPNIEQGTFAVTGGEIVRSSNAGIIRTKTLVHVSAGETISVNSGYQMSYATYDADKQYVSYQSSWVSSVTPSVERYFFIKFRKSDSSTLTPDELDNVVNSGLDIMYSGVSPFGEIDALAEKLDSVQSAVASRPTVEQGTFLVVNGVMTDSESDTRIRTGLIPVASLVSTTIVFTTSEGYRGRVARYDSSGSYISGSLSSWVGSYSLASVIDGTAYIRITVRRNDDEDLVTPDEIGTAWIDYESTLILFDFGTIDALQSDIDTVRSDKWLNVREGSIENSAWSWWVYPQVAMDITRRNRAYFGMVNDLGIAGVGSKDLDSAREAKTLLWQCGRDDHNGMCLFKHPTNKKYYAVGTGHNIDNYLHIYRSIGTDNPDYFQKLDKIGVYAYVTYAQMFYDSTNRRLAILCRVGTTHWHIVYSNDANGDSWGDSMPVVKSSMQYYCMFRPTTTPNLLRICMYSNPQSNDTNIRMGFLDLSNGKIYNADGATQLGTVEQGVNFESFSIVIPVESGKRNRLLDVFVSAPEALYICYAAFTDETDATYKVYYNGETKDVASAGKCFYTASVYVGGMIFDPSDHDVLYVSRHDGTNDILEKRVLSAGGYETDSVIDSVPDGRWVIRPIADPSGKVLVYQRGITSQSSFTDYKYDARVVEIGQ